MPSLVLPYLALKASLSRRLAKSDASPRLPVPRFASPEEVSAFITAHLRWTGDKWWLDAYLDPQLVQAAMEIGVQPLHVDCDDFAVWCYAALAQLQGYRVQLWTVVDFWVAASHVVCTYRAPDGTCGLLSNGRHRPILADEAWAVRLDVEEEFAGYRWAAWWPKAHFVAAVPTPYPFDSPL